MPVVKRTIFLEVLEYLQYSDTEKCRKTAKKKEQLENNLYFWISILFILHILIHSIFRGTMKKHESI